MTGPRISLAACFGIIVICAAVFAGMRSASGGWFKSIYTLTFLSLLCGAIVARYRGAFWHGFAVVGWAYFVLGFGPWIGKYPDELNNHFLTSSIAKVASTVLDPEPDRPSGDRTKEKAYQSLMEVRQSRVFNRDGICHSFLTVLFACVGGAVAMYVDSRSHRNCNAISM